MSLPLFFYAGNFSEKEIIALPQDTAHYVVNVLRMKPGADLRLTSGQGAEAFASIAEAGKKHCSVQVSEIENHSLPEPALHLAVAFTKSASRNEWLLEKATEMGVRTIIPLIAQRSEKERFKKERWEGILTSAILQSQQYYLPVLMQPTPLPEILKRFNSVPQKLLAHCMEQNRTPLKDALKPQLETLLLIGPEGDFTKEEVEQSLQQNCKSISLGNTRLRTETAAMAAVAYFNLINN